MKTKSQTEPIKFKRESGGIANPHNNVLTAKEHKMWKRRHKIKAALVSSTLVVGVGGGIGAGYAIADSQKDTGIKITTEGSLQVDNPTQKATITATGYGGVNNKITAITGEAISRGVLKYTINNNVATITLGDHPTAGEYEVTVQCGSKTEVASIAITDASSIQATVSGSLQMNDTSKTATITLTGTGGASSTITQVSGDGINTNSLTSSITNGVATISLGTNPTVGEYTLTITNGSQTTSAKITVLDAVGLTTTVSGSLQMNDTSKSATITLTGTGGASSTIASVTGFAITNSLLAVSLSSNVATISLGTNPTVGEYTLTITNGTESTTTTIAVLDPATNWATVGGRLIAGDITTAALITLYGINGAITTISKIEPNNSSENYFRFERLSNTEYY
ncbi:MAG: hypothetical protein LBD63_03290, partial [Mycoplasmataceae bacterium]|nr:hypothetical protein [Mycoplasmataceae bacterium]